MYCRKENSGKKNDCMSSHIIYYLTYMTHHPVIKYGSQFFSVTQIDNRL